MLASGGMILAPSLDTISVRGLNHSSDEIQLILSSAHSDNILPYQNLKFIFSAMNFYSKEQHMDFGLVS